LFLWTESKQKISLLCLLRSLMPSPLRYLTAVSTEFTMNSGSFHRSISSRKREVTHDGRVQAAIFDTGHPAEKR
ncbi:hypothetical protein Leryth_020553, partial [Lithospermum erythrorhizon]